MNEFAEVHDVPVEAVRANAETIYPEYELKLARMPVPPLPPSTVTNSKAGIWIDSAGDPHNVPHNVKDAQ